MRWIPVPIVSAGKVVMIARCSWFAGGRLRVRGGIPLVRDGLLLGLSLLAVAAVVALGGIPLARADSAPVLSLSRAEAMALQQDPAVAASLARAEALEADSVAAGQLPDPKFRTGLYNLPLDDFDIERNPTTQLRLGLQQRFPRGDTRKYRAAKKRSLAELERRRAVLERLRIRRDLRKTYLDAWYQAGALRILRDSRRLFENLTDITEVQYGSGSSSQQDVLRAELELSRLDDRITRVQSMEEQARAKLSRWVGQAAWNRLDENTPRIPTAPDRQVIASKLADHPELRVQQARIEALQQDVGLARAQYKPGWMVGAEYRKRFGDNPDGSDRADMAAVMLSVDVPLFTEKRQDKRLAASKKRLAAADLDQANIRRKLLERLARDESARQRLRERLARYENRLQEEAEQNAAAALQAYQSGTADFTALMRARITELDIHVQALKLRTDLLKTQSDLLYLAGEDK